MHVADRTGVPVLGLRALLGLSTELEEALLHCSRGGAALDGRTEQFEYRLISPEVGEVLEGEVDGAADTTRCTKRPKLL